MNYRHDFHAGNFADVFKHIVLSRMLEYFKSKDKAFRVIDTHAGSGLYELASADQRDHRGQRPEWVRGIDRLDGWQPSAEAWLLLEPYFNALNTCQEGYYPGSPLVTMAHLRNQDRLTACELHPQAADRLKQVFEGNYRARIIELDGWLVAGSQLPPKEKRGLLFIDPPFEKPAEFNRILDAFQKAAKRWAGGTVAAWYPLKFENDVTLFKRLVRESGLNNIVCYELMIDRPANPPKLFGNGIIIRNAPYLLESEMRQIMPELAKRLENGKRLGGWHIERIVGE